MDAFVDFMPATILLWTFKTKAVVNQLLQLACFSLMWSSLSKIELGSHRETRFNFHIDTTHKGYHHKGVSHKT